MADHVSKRWWRLPWSALWHHVVSQFMVTLCPTAGGKALQWMEGPEGLAERGPDKTLCPGFRPTLVLLLPEGNRGCPGVGASHLSTARQPPVICSHLLVVRVSHPDCVTSSKHHTNRVLSQRKEETVPKIPEQVQGRGSGTPARRLPPQAPRPVTNWALCGHPLAGSREGWMKPPRLSVSVGVTVPARLCPPQAEAVSSTDGGCVLHRRTL